jgi:hypothetical protein
VSGVRAATGGTAATRSADGEAAVPPDGRQPSETQVSETRVQSRPWRKETEYPMSNKECPMMKCADGTNEMTQGLPFSLQAHFGIGSSLLDIGYSSRVQYVTPGSCKWCPRAGTGRGRRSRSLCLPTSSALESTLY